MNAAAAFESEMMAAIPRVRAAAWRLTGRGQEVEDLVQDTLVKALAHRDSYTVGSNMAAWMCFICRNLFLSGKRRAWRSVEMDEEWSKTIPSLDNPHNSLALKEVLDALQYIPKEQVEALLIIAEGQSYEDAAQVLGCEVGTLKSRVSRARDAIDNYFSAA